MSLTKLEIAGFKSFAKTSVLSFPSRVTAIVGPNGSGKSNITEAIRWVLGEQSMKVLRGKKGEDLIWSGSPSGGTRGHRDAGTGAAHSTSGNFGSGIARMGKAAVSLVFDNLDGKIPLDFQEVILTRKIFRDGANEYFINDSAVRLRDVVELIARMGLGEQKHNIISQGEVDRLLLATSRERHRMLEEALGLRVWQLKKNEAERKLDATRRNLEQADALIRELTPHLKFLRLQAKRAEAVVATRQELEDLERIYVTREERSIAEETAALDSHRDPLQEKQVALKKDVGRFTAEVRSAEAAALPSVDAAQRDQRITTSVQKRQELEREIGRLEGKMEAITGHAAPAPSERTPDTGEIQGGVRAIDTLRDILGRMRTLIREQDDIETIRSRFFPLITRAEEELDLLILQGPASPAPVHAGVFADLGLRQLGQTLRVLGVELEQISAGIVADEDERRRTSEGLQVRHERLRELERDLAKKRDEEREVSLILERMKLDEERIEERRRRLKYIIEGGVRDERSDDTVLHEKFAAVGQEELSRRIERNRVRLEEAGGIDAGVVKEYEDTEARHAFLVREREDVAAAAVSLAGLIKELDARIAQDFKEGFAKIKDAFHDYFRIVFGGGSGKLRLAAYETRGVSAEEDSGEEAGEKEEKEEGIEIEVDLPRKRIHSLAMLSGGERALTAIALLFAITAVNPPPFLILDETDAALDEANSQRYAAILTELAKKTQLIVVTHNRETMKSAGVLYGVTMGDDGVSRLLSLKLEQAEEYTNR